MVKCTNTCLLLLTVLLQLVCGCATYVDEFKEVKALYKKKDYQVALDKFNQLDLGESEKNRLLYNFEKAILLDRKEILPCAAFLTGEYGINGLYAGVPVKLGAKGIEEIIEVELTNDESAALNASAESVQELVDIMAKA